MYKRFEIIFVAAVVLVSLDFESARGQTETAKFEISAVFTAIRQGDDFYEIAREFEQRTRHNIGGGGRFTFNLTDSIALEGELTFHPKERGIFIGGLFPLQQSGSFIGGERTQGLFGMKAGKRMERFGVFGKFRPGFMRFSRVPDCPGGEVARCTSDGKNEPAFDLGGVFEYYPSRRLVVRFDAGDTIIRYRKLTRANFGNLPPDPRFPLEVGGGTVHNAQYSVGFGIRF